MRRSVLMLFLFAGDSVLFAAGSSDLLVAIRNGDHVQVQKLLRTGADVNTADNDGTTAKKDAHLEDYKRHVRTHGC